MFLIEIFAYVHENNDKKESSNKMMKLVLYIFQFIGILLCILGGYHVYKARQIEGMGGLGAGFLGAAEIGLGAIVIILSLIIYWIQKWRANRKRERETSAANNKQLEPWSNE